MIVKNTNDASFDSDSLGDVHSVNNPSESQEKNVNKPGNIDTENYYKVIPAKLNWTPKIMEDKIMILEKSLNNYKEVLLEKEITFEEQIKMIAKIEEKVNLTKKENLAKAIELNTIKTKFREIVQKMMSIVSEVSVYQANSVKLEVMRNNYVNNLTFIEGKMMKIYHLKNEKEIRDKNSALNQSKNSSLNQTKNSSPNQTKNSSINKTHLSGGSDGSGKLTNSLYIVIIIYNSIKL